MGNQIIVTEESTAMTGEIGDMLGDTPLDDDAGTGDDVTTEASEDAAGSTDTEGVSTEAEAGYTETPSVTDTEGGVQAEAGAAAGETETLVEDIAAIRQRIADMATTNIEVVSPEAEPFDPMAGFTEDMAYITEDNLQQIADNPLLLNTAMNEVRRKTAEGILNVVPQMIAHAIQEQTQRTEMHNTFYGEHKELIPFKAYVSSVAKTMAEKMKDKTQEEILAEVAKSVKASLQLVPKKVEGKKDGAKPALRNSTNGGGRKTKIDVDENSLAAQITAMMK